MYCREKMKYVSTGVSGCDAVIFSVITQGKEIYGSHKKGRRVVILFPPLPLSSFRILGTARSPTCPKLAPVSI